MLLLLSHFSRVQSSRPHGLQPTRLLCPWDFPGESTSSIKNIILDVTSVCLFKCSSSSSSCNFLLPVLSRTFKSKQKKVNRKLCFSDLESEEEDGEQMRKLNLEKEAIAFCSINQNHIFSRLPVAWPQRPHQREVRTFFCLSVGLMKEWPWPALSSSSAPV